MRATAALVLTVAIGVAACTDQTPRPATTRSDVIFITIDTTRADHLTVYGYQRPTSPVLAELAKTGIVFDRAWSTAPWTLPSHASMFTGQYPTTHGAHHDPAGEEMFGNRVRRLDQSALTLAEILKERGYATGAFAGGPWLAPEFGLLQGFDFRHAGLEDGSSLLASEKKGRKFEVRVNWSAEELSDRAISWLEAVEPGQNVHLFINYFDPHFPYQLRKDFDVANADTPATAGDEQAKIDAYDSEIRFMDHHLGRVLEALRKARRFDGALIVVVADHGESFGEHGNHTHGPWLYEELLRVPLIIKLPNAERAGSRIEDPVSVVDLVPIILAKLGLELPPGIEGVLVGDREMALAEAFRSEVVNKIAPGRYDRDLFAGIRWPWKLVVSDAGNTELYDLASDPRELHNRAGDDAEADLRKQLDSARATLTAPARRDVPESHSPNPIDPALAERMRALGYGD